MYKFQFSALILFLMCGVMLSSCAKEEESTIDYEYTPVEQTAEEYIAANEVPAIMFSYNVLNTKTNILASWLIDADGNIRSAENESDVVYEGTNLSQYYMNEKKSSSSTSGSNVELDELVGNFKNLRSAEKLGYDKAEESKESATITTVYGYYYASSMQDEACGCESDGSLTVQLYDAILLEQKTNNTIIQSNANASAILAWLNELNVQGE